MTHSSTVLALTHFLLSLLCATWLPGCLPLLLSPCFIGLVGCATVAAIAVAAAHPWCHHLCRAGWTMLLLFKRGELARRGKQCVVVTVGREPGGAVQQSQSYTLMQNGGQNGWFVHWVSVMPFSSEKFPLWDITMNPNVYLSNIEITFPPRLINTMYRPQLRKEFVKLQISHSIAKTVFEI